MKRQRFSDEQIIGFLKQAESGRCGEGAVPNARL